MPLVVSILLSLTVAQAAPAPPAAPPAQTAPANPAAPPADKAPPVPAVPASIDPAQNLPRVLVFSKTTGFRHKSIPFGVTTIRELGANTFAVDTTEDGAAFTAPNLAKYRAVVFLSTTGDVLNNEQQTAFEGFVHGGGGFAGVHAAADTEYEWPWYGKLVGAYFKGHPEIQKATVKVEDRAHRSTRALPEKWERTDEWYSFRTNPRADTTVLASLDETTYKPGELAMGDHPIAWYHAYDGGRAWYTACGHAEDSFRDPNFRTHLREGILWAAGMPDDAVAPATPAAPATGQPKLIKSSVFTTIPVLAEIPVALSLAAVMVVAAVVMGTMGQGVRAPLLAWVFPGLGHLSLGYRRRGMLAMIGVLGMMVTGVAVGGVDAIDSREDAAWFIAQAGNGPLAFGVDTVNQQLLKTGKVGELIQAPPRGETMVSSYKGLGAANEFGTLMISLGGLMNLVLMMDCARRDPASGKAD